jgi:hypothetical protein
MKEFWFKSFSGLMCVLVIISGPAYLLFQGMGWNVGLSGGLLGVSVAAIRRGVWIILNEKEKRGQL